MVVPGRKPRPYKLAQYVIMVSSGALAVAVLTGTQAFAQAATQDPPKQTDTSQSNATSSEAAPPPVVVVQGQKKDVSDRIDRRVYNVANDPDAQTGLAADVLGKLPSVQVSPAGAVTLRGDSHVHILVDGKYPANGNQVIESLAASDIDRIEVITNPSAQYSPDGTAGIINIITKKRHKLGFGGNLNARATSQGEVFVAPSLTFTNGPWSIDGRVTLKHTPSSGRSETDIFVPAEIVEPQRYSGQSDSSLASLSVAYKASELSTFTFGLSDYRAASNNFTTGAYTSDVTAYDRALPAGELLNQLNVEGTYDYANDKTGTQFTLDMNHGENETSQHYLETDIYRNGSKAVYGSRSVIKGPDDEIQGDYEKDYSGDRVLKAGFEWDYTDDSTLEVFTNTGDVAGPVADGLTHTFGITQSIASAYFTYQTPLGSWTLLPGLRVEREQHTIDATGFDGTVSEVRWYPSLHLQHGLGEHSKLKLNYSRRVQRPELTSYDPSPSLVTSAGETVGNPYLKPTDTDSFEVEYNYTQKTFNFETALFYRANSNLFSEVTTARNDGYLITSTTNAGRSHAAGGELTLKWNLPQTNGSTWKYSVNANLSDVELQRLGVGERDYFQPTGNGQLEYDTSSGDQYQANLTFRGKAYSVQGYTDAGYRMDLSYQHPIGKKLVLTASITDLTNSGKTITIIDVPGLRSRTFARPADQAFRIGLSWKFGNKAK